MMRSTYHEELDPLESLEGPPRGPQKYEFFENKNVFALLCVLGPQEHFSKKKMYDPPDPPPHPRGPNIQNKYFCITLCFRTSGTFYRFFFFSYPTLPPGPQYTIYKKNVFALLCVLGPQEHFSKKKIMTLPTPTPGTSNIQKKCVTLWI